MPIPRLVSAVYGKSGALESLKILTVNDGTITQQCFLRQNDNSYAMTQDISDRSDYEGLDNIGLDDYFPAHTDSAFNEVSFSLKEVQSRITTVLAQSLPIVYKKAIPALNQTLLSVSKPVIIEDLEKAQLVLATQHYHYNSKDVTLTGVPLAPPQKPPARTR